MLFITVMLAGKEDCKGVIVTLVNKWKTIDEKRRDLLRHVKPSFCDDAKAVACMYSREILIIIIVIYQY